MTVDSPTAEELAEAAAEAEAARSLLGARIDDPPAGDPESAPGDSDEPAKRTPNQEAAARRVQLRNVEAERDALAQAVTSLQRQAIEGMIVSDPALAKLHRITDLWDSGVNPGDLTDEAGAISSEKVADALGTLRTERPYLFQPDPLHEFGRTFLSQEAPPGAAPTFANALGTAIATEAGKHFHTP